MKSKEEDGYMEKDFSELEEMRKQVALLKEKLDKESIVNDKLLRNVMKTKMDYVNNYHIKSIVIGIFAMIIIYFDFVILFPLSTALVIFTEVALLGVITFGYMNKRLINSANIMGGNLVEECKKLVRYKKREITYLYYFGIPYIIVWLSWVFYDMNKYIDDKNFAITLSISCIIGGIIGGVIGLNMFRKTMKRINEVIEQINTISE